MANETTPPPITAEALQELKRLEREATAGPWRHSIATYEGARDLRWAQIDVDGLILLRTVEAQEPLTNDLRLVAALRNAAPQLLAAAERALELEAENERLKGDLLLERSSVGRADLQTKVLLANDQRDRAWKLLRELGVTVMP